jgi:hypothetical protein
MPKIIVNPGSPSAWEISLKPGINRLGRASTNEVVLTDPSVSGTHCEITVNDQSAVIKDLGSTNGTYVNRAPVQETRLESGATVHTGSLLLMFLADDAPMPAVAPAPIAARATAAPAARVVARPVAATPAVAVSDETPPPPMMATTANVPMIPPAPQKCKSHPKTLGRFYCNHCHHFFCDLCVITRTGATGAGRFCRQCGAECVPVQMPARSQAKEKGFFARLPGSFVYPFKGSGLLMLIIATIIFTLLDAVGGGFSFLARIAAVGYLFSFMQNIIHCTAAGDEELPELPAFDGLFGAFLSLAGTVVFCFAPAILLGVARVAGMDVPDAAILAAMLLSCFYFPMAFLAVAMKDTLLAANPLIVIPSILKVPLEYLVAAIALGAVFGLRLLGKMLTSSAAAEGLTTKDMSVLLTGFGVAMFWSFASVYLLTVGMRILGLLYVTKKQRLGWFAH